MLGAADGTAGASRGLSPLPEGSAPEPVKFPHFPDRLHAFVWRNWALLPVERMALTVGAAPEDILALGKSMGLPDSAPSKDALRRGALTIIRRNWHLLPYDQLLTLLGWTAEELAFTLREDDFFYIKLGSLKPRCPALKWSPPDDAAGRQAAWIREKVREHFPNTGELAGRDPLFAFADRLAAMPEGDAGAGKASPAKENEPLRMCYSCFGLYGDPLLTPELDPYPEGLLLRLRQTGVNAVWMPALLSKLSPFPWDPSVSKDFEKRRESLRHMVARARRHGISIILYLNEPRMMPLSFFKERGHLKGVQSGDHAALCTSTPEVRDYLREAMAGLCAAVPDLGGFFTISASENPTHCWSHGAGASCPRCKSRTAAEVIGTLHQDLAAGITKAGGKQRLIAWDWGWGDAWAEQAIAGLPARAELMSVSEWSLPITRGGIASEVGEYCLSATGPGPRALRHWKAAQARGLRVIAKIQAALSWEFSAAPWLPVVHQAARHARNLREAGVNDLMLGWTLGGSPSPNFEALESGPEAPARRRAEDQAPVLLTFWEKCSQAVQEFPFHISVVYQAPLQFGPSNLLWDAPTNYKAAMVGLAYDDLDSWRAIYPPEVFIGQLEKTAAGFQAAVTECRAAFPGGVPEPVRQELDFAETAALHWQSTANQSRFILARNGGAKSTESAQALILQAEITAAKRLHALQSTDARIGFEASNQYYYIPTDLVEKVLCCLHLAGDDASAR
ncbi:MAG: hypothetical protein EOP86_10995 [Verrucomicrobiaceae bacterium]|nr:MAG: hypothetical protein EOP86_10995 [Verrucomicrobiaceae bacterium]